MECIKFQQFQGKITLIVCKFCTSTQTLQENALFSWKIYTQLAQILHDRRSRRSQQISTLVNASLSRHYDIQMHDF